MRKLWFITRPERDPQFHKDALEALSIATNNFSIKWLGNREAHFQYELVLNEKGLKRKNVSNDGSGGRTWAALLRTFAYCYLDEKGFIVPTKVGEAILKGDNEHANITKQILTLQIPNAYFLEKGFRPKYEESFAIRPARFLISLTNQERLDHYLTKEEITYFGLSAKRDSDLDQVIESIRTFRKADPDERKIIKKSIAQKFEHRARKDNVARDFESAHSDVAHTFMLICDYTGYVEYVRGKDIRIAPSESSKVTKLINEYEGKYPFNKRYMISLQRMAETNGLDIRSFKATRMGNIKPATNKSKRLLKAKSILSDFATLSEVTHDEITNVLSNHFNYREASKIADDLLKEKVLFKELNTDFVEGYLKENDNLKFEDKTGEVFKRIGFDVEMRPVPTKQSDVTTRIEILVKYNGKYCGIVDAKNYKEKFSLNPPLRTLMATEYIPNYDGFDNHQLEFFCYITAADFSGEKSLKHITNKAEVFIKRKVKGAIISASTLLSFLDYCIENEIEKQDRVQMFIEAIQNRGYKTFGQLISQINKSALL